MPGYIENQLESVKPDDVGFIHTQFIGRDGGKTNWLLLTPEQFAEIKALMVGWERGK